MTTNNLNYFLLTMSAYVQEKDNEDEYQPIKATIGISTSGEFFGSREVVTLLTGWINENLDGDYELISVPAILFCMPVTEDQFLHFKTH